MARFIITARREGSPVTSYLGNTVATFSAERATVFRTLKEARAELEYRQREAPAYQWTVEELGRGPLASAILKAKPVAV